MQSEEVDDVTISTDVKSPLLNTEMTFSEARDSPSPSSKSQVNLGSFKAIQDADYKLSEINYEADIEKMVPESTSGSDSEDGSKLEVVGPDSPTSEVPRDHLKHLKEQTSNESIRTWLQKISQMQTEIQQKLSLEQNTSANHSFDAFPAKPNNFGQQSLNVTPQNSSRVVKYQDLPYMGEMTLDNSKPRRGRKPKKADICHLIYKNYGTIFPGTPNPKSLIDRDPSINKKAVAENKSTDITLNETLNRSDVQNRIISSLLEKRLTQESKRQKEIIYKPSKITQKPIGKGSNQNEPLNLCVRDLNQLKIRLLRKSDDTYTSEVKSEPTTDDDDVEFVKETPSPSSQVNDIKLPNLTPEAFSSAFLSPDGAKTSENGVAPGGYVYWPNAGVFIHPMALQQQLMYYQKIAQNSNFTLPSNSPRPPPETVSSPETSGVPELRKLAPKARPKKNDTNGDTETSNPVEQKSKRNATSGSEKTPIKRKRSAIFIPPIPAENQTNPATEVSICKFKFTGGAKPSLQEKKMLSVDSGGNFRYYSGTGDKSMRGYEFFPRETLQQQIGNAQGSSTGAFLQASGEKIHPSTMIDFSGKQAHSEFMLTPDLPAAIPRIPDLSPRHKKRKSRKSLQREKLEQTFKEKGFLIQTQQLESAEGATYCKFRQLRKFTRYLFRSWKDYLPGNVTEGQDGERSENDEVTEQDLENLSRLSQNGLSCSSSDVPTTV